VLSSAGVAEGYELVVHPAKSLAGSWLAWSSAEEIKCH
jgi:hypothetical protein